MSQMQARFVQGSIMRHVITMTVTGAVGLVSIFLVDAINLFYISLLKKVHLTAALGFASSLIFVLTSVSIGLVIAATVLVSRSLGAGEREEARHLATSSLQWNLVFLSVAVVVTMVFSAQLLRLIGATGEAYEAAWRYLMIVMPTNLLLGIGMVYSGILRAVGDARRAMWVTLAGGIVAAIFDPILILWLDWGLEGAAIATAFSRLTIFAVGYHGAVRVHDLAARPSLARMLHDRLAVFRIAVPAILTNVATPVGLAMSTAIFSQLGPEVVAGMTVADRLVPLCFGVFFALTGAVGPIIGQNLGARQFDRVYRSVADSLVLIAVYSLVMCGLLAIFAEQIADLFHAVGDARRFVIFFCHFGALGFAFVGVMFTANTAFNTLGFPLYATFFNWFRALVGNGLMAYFGFQIFTGPARLEGAYSLSIIAGALISVVSVLVCFRVIGKMRSTVR